MSDLPTELIYPIVFIYGLVVGSFLNVVIYRLHTGKSLGGHSHCLSCNHPLSWFELVPVVSYLVLRGRCRECGAYIPWRYLLVELLTGIAFVLATTSQVSFFGLLVLCTFLSVLIVGGVYDLYHMIIPDEVVYALVGLAGLLILINNFNNDWRTALLTGVIAGVAAAAPLFLLWFFSDGRWIGLGDAKLVLALGALVGLDQVFSLVVLAFWAGAFSALLLLLSQKIIDLLHRQAIFGYRRRVKMKSEIPFAPFLIVSFLMVYFFQVDVLKISLDVLSLYSF